MFSASSLYPQEQPQDKFEIDLSDLQKEVDKAAAKPYSLGGFVEAQPALLGLDRDSTFSRARFFRNPPPSVSDQHNFRLRLEGSLKKDIFSAFFKTDTHVQNDFDEWTEQTKLFEAYGSVKPSPNLIFEAGKKVMKWGKGYAWNPVSFIDRPKNPEDPEEALEGSTVATADYIKSFDGPLKTVALTTALIPVYRHVNADFGKLYHLNFASKLYLLLYDTDLDFMVLTGSSRTTRYGFDFSKNLTTNLEIHGEWAAINNFKIMSIDQEGRPSVQGLRAISYLLGFRYLTEKETTYILEYYYNGTGFTKNQFEDFVDFADAGFHIFERTGKERALRSAGRLAEGAYGRPNPGQHYLYFRASQKEPFDILYFTPALTSIINLQDGSLVVIPELAYTPITNLELRLRTPVLIGGKKTEYGEKQNDYRVEFRLRYYFGL